MQRLEAVMRLIVAINLGIVGLALLVSVITRHLPAMLAVILLGTTSVALMLVPASDTAIVSVAGAFGSLLIATVGAFARRRQLEVERRLDDLETRFLRARTDLESFFLHQSRAARERMSRDGTEKHEKGMAAGTVQGTADAD